jgi:hypothetical protein
LISVALFIAMLILDAHAVGFTSSPSLPSWQLRLVISVVPQPGGFRASGLTD